MHHIGQWVCAALNTSNLDRRFKRPFAGLASARELVKTSLAGQSQHMSEIIFEVREADEGGFWARSLGHSIFTQGEDWNDLRAMVKDAVACHFGKDEERPKIIRLHYVRDEVLAA